MLLQFFLSLPKPSPSVLARPVPVRVNDEEIDVDTQGASGMFLAFGLPQSLLVPPAPSPAILKMEPLGRDPRIHPRHRRIVEAVRRNFNRTQTAVTTVNTTAQSALSTAQTATVALPKPVLLAQSFAPGAFVYTTTQSPTFFLAFSAGGGQSGIAAGAGCWIYYSITLPIGTTLNSIVGAGGAPGNAGGHTILDTGPNPVIDLAGGAGTITGAPAPTSTAPNVTVIASGRGGNGGVNHNASGNAGGGGGSGGTGHEQDGSPGTASAPGAGGKAFGYGAVGANGQAAFVGGGGAGGLPALGQTGGGGYIKVFGAVQPMP